jgi:hypothetical protein
MSENHELFWEELSRVPIDQLEYKPDFSMLKKRVFLVIFRSLLEPENTCFLWEYMQCALICPGTKYSECTDDSVMGCLDRIYRRIVTAYNTNDVIEYRDLCLSVAHLNLQE